MRTVFKALLVFVFVSAFMCHLSIFAGEDFAKPLQGAKIAIDSGNGVEGVPESAYSENDRKALSPTEAKINKKIVSYLKFFLEQAGASVVITPFGESADKRMEAAAAANPHFILSVNFNYSKNPDIDFTTVYYGNTNREITVALASDISKALSAQIKNENMGAQYSEIPILKLTNIPTGIIDCAFITKKTRYKEIKDDEAPRNIAIGILNGTVKFWESKKNKFIQDTSSTHVKETKTSSEAVEKNIKTQTGNFPPPPTVKDSLSAPPPPPMQIDNAVTSNKPMQQFLPFNPPFANPVNGTFDQTYLFGETYGNLKPKRSVSFSVPRDTSVLAVADGEVVDTNATGKTSELSDYPNYILIKHIESLNAQPVFSLYGNVKDISVRNGEKVMKGQPIGKTGDPFAATKKRDTELEFEIRVGGNSPQYVRNPELYIKPTSTGAGAIVGKIKDKNGIYMPKLKITGVTKVEAGKGFGYSLTYAPEIPISGEYKENLAISELKPGNYTLMSEAGNISVEVKADTITLIDWVASK